MQERPGRDLILWFFLALFLIFIFLLGWLLLPFLHILILAAVVTGIFNPIYLFIQARLKASYASLITCIIIFIVLFVPIVLFGGILANEAYNLIQMAKVPSVKEWFHVQLAGSRLLLSVNQLLATINMEISGEQLNGVIAELAKKIGPYLVEWLKPIGVNVLNFAVDFFFMLLIVFFLFLDSEKLLTFIIELSPLPKDQDEKLINKFKDMAGAILIGNGLAGLIQGILGGVVFALFGLTSPMLWGAIMGVLAFLPIVGVGAVFLPAAIYLLIKGRIAAGIFFIAFYLILSGGIEYIFKPKVVGDRVKMHTLLVFLAIMGGLKLFGILGIIYGPLIVTGFLTLADIYHLSYQKIVETSGDDSMCI